MVRLCQRMTRILRLLAGCTSWGLLCFGNDSSIGWPASRQSRLPLETDMVMVGTAWHAGMITLTGGRPEDRDVHAHIEVTRGGYGPATRACVIGMD